MKLVNSSQEGPQYEIKVREPPQTECVYRTVGVLSHVGADSLIGRGTRVWKARKLDEYGSPSGPECALKDVWVRSDRPIEHKVIADIKKAQPEYREHFLTVLEAGFVLVGQSNSQPDNTKETIRRGQDFVLTEQVLRPRPAIENNVQGTLEKSWSTGHSTGSSQHTPVASPRGHWDYSKVNLFPRLHYRIVFEEVGTAVHHLRSYHDIITAVTGGSRGKCYSSLGRTMMFYGLSGLHAIHLTGQVHRDVSSGNILLAPKPGGQGVVGKIIDLEYVKKLATESNPHDIKTVCGSFRSGMVCLTICELNRGHLNLWLLKLPNHGMLMSLFCRPVSGFP